MTAAAASAAAEEAETRARSAVSQSQKAAEMARRSGEEEAEQARRSAREELARAKEEVDMAAEEERARACEEVYIVPSVSVCTADRLFFGSSGFCCVEGTWRGWCQLKQTFRVRKPRFVLFESREAGSGGTGGRTWR